MAILPAGGFGRATIGGLVLGTAAGAGAPAIADRLGGESALSVATFGTASVGLVGMGREFARVPGMTAAQTGVAARCFAMGMTAIIAGTVIAND